MISFMARKERRTCVNDNLECLCIYFLFDGRCGDGPIESDRITELYIDKDSIVHLLERNS